MRKAAALAGSWFVLAMATPSAFAQDAETPPEDPAAQGNGAEVTLSSEETSIETPSGNTVTKTVAPDQNKPVVDVEKAETPGAVERPERPDRPEAAQKPEHPERPETPQKPDTPGQS